MYRWQGDLGLLDRLAYNSLDTVPLNWATSIDAGRIEQYVVQLEIPIHYQSTEDLSPAHPPLPDQIEDQRASAAGFASTQSIQGLTNSGLSQAPKKRQGPCTERD